MRTHLERAVQLATEQGKPAGLCEALALLAIEAARLGRETSDDELLDVGQDAAERVLALADSLPGHPPWRAKANAAMTHVRRARPDRGDPLETAFAALGHLQSSEQEELFLDIWLACLPPILASGNEEAIAGLTRSALLRARRGR